MLNINKILIIVHCIILVFSSNAQDIHFTQFDNSPLNLNPAYTGMFQGSHRISLINRDQWRAVTKPFTTLAASYDTRLKSNDYLKEIFGAGLVLYRDKAGDSEYGTTQANLSLSYIKAIDKQSQHFLSFGLQCGLAQRTIDYNKLHFDNQYNGYMYDPTISVDETFKTENFLYPDFNAGIGWNYYIKNNSILQSGIALFHINRPEQSLLKNNNIKLNQKIAFNINVLTPITAKVFISPSVLYLNQHPGEELNFGTMIYIVKDNNPYSRSSFNIGIFTRESDAAIFTAGIDYKTLSLNFSYDVNYSDLHKASDARGAFEVSLIYRFFNKDFFKKECDKCRFL